MDKRTYYYARVSSKSQNLARQIEAFKKDGANDHDIITEQQSGKNMDRPEYQAMKTHMLRPGDTLVVMSLDRLGRNKEAIKEELRYYKEHHIRVRILDLPTTNINVPQNQEWVIDVVNNILIEVKYREGAPIADDDAIVELCEESSAAIIITKNADDFGVHNTKCGKDLLRIPAFAFLYSLGNAEKHGYRGIEQ